MASQILMKLCIFNKPQEKSMPCTGTVRSTFPIIPGSNLTCHTHYIILFYQKCILQHPVRYLVHFPTSWRPTTPTFQRQAYTHAKATANSPHPCIYRHNSCCQFTTCLHIQIQQLQSTHHIPVDDGTQSIDIHVLQ